MCRLFIHNHNGVRKIQGSFLVLKLFLILFSPKITFRMSKIQFINKEKIKIKSKIQNQIEKYSSLDLNLLSQVRRSFKNTSIGSLLLNLT